MITYKEFFDKYNGKHVEVAGSVNAQNQCVDLANAYIREVLGLPIIEWTNAQDFPKKCLPPNYEYILNTPTGVPIQGDIMIWKSPDNIGHIGICDSATATKFVSFDQNWPVGSVCKLVNHTYTGTYTVTGWLRGKKKEEDMTEEQKKIFQIIEENKLTEGDIRWLSDLKKNDTVKKLEETVSELRSTITANQNSVTVCQSDLATANAKIKEIIDADKMTAWQHIRYGIQLLINQKK